MTAGTNAEIIVVGLTENGQPRAARFATNDEALVRRAAGKLGYQVAIVTGRPDVKTVQALRPGHVYRTAKLFAGPVRPKVYSAILQIVAAYQDSAPGSSG